MHQYLSVSFSTKTVAHINIDVETVSLYPEVVPCLHVLISSTLDRNNPKEKEHFGTILIQVRKVFASQFYLSLNIHQRHKYSKDILEKSLVNMN